MEATMTLFPNLFKSGIEPAKTLTGFKKNYLSCMVGDCGECGSNECNCDCSGPASDCDCDCHDCDCNCDDW